ncbi:hypothetical protein MOKP4_30570 [Mycobacterium avium subsp. hominissuis]|jgi:hypothetical protein
MFSAKSSSQLQVSDGGLRLEAARCDALAGKLSANTLPSVDETSPLSSAAAVEAACEQVAEAGVRSARQVQATAAKLRAAAAGYDTHEARAAADLRAVESSRVC